MISLDPGIYVQNSVIIFLSARSKNTESCREHVHLKKKNHYFACSLVVGFCTLSKFQSKYVVLECKEDLLTA